MRQTRSTERSLLVVGLIALMLGLPGCYRKVIRAEGYGARVSNPTLEQSNVPENDPVGDFLFGPRPEPRQVNR